MTSYCDATVKNKIKKIKKFQKISSTHSLHNIFHKNICAFGGFHPCSKKIIINGCGAFAYVSFKVGADPHNASLDGHLESETDDSPDLQQGLFTEAPAGLRAR